MALQALIDWWENLVVRKREEDSCGAWPMAIPPWADIFIHCCSKHDPGYRVSEVLYARGVVERRQDLKDQGLKMKAQADNDFILCVRARYMKSYFFTRPITKLHGEQYIKLVLANGDRIWFRSVGRRIAAYESGDTPVIQMALKRANLGER